MYTHILLKISEMSEREFRRGNIPAKYRKTISSTRAPRPSPETRRQINREAGGNLPKPSENVNVLKSSKSEPSLCGGDVAAVVEEEEEAGVLYRPQTCVDIFSSPASRKCSQVYNKDAKVVVNVIVEGSPGPIRTMVKLGSSVEETIKLVINKYNEEGRSPHLDKNAAATFELHHSYFSLESLSKTDLIGDAGSRSFFLRKCSSSSSGYGGRAEDVSASSTRLPPPSLSTLPSFICRKMRTILQRTRKFWKIFGCIACIP